MKKLGLVVMLVLLACSVSASAEPLGYPWISWGEVSQTWDDFEEGVKLDAYAEQGIDWCKVAQSEWILNTYAGLGVNVSDDESDWWNNEIEPRIGVEVHRPFSTEKINWGDIAVGTRLEYHRYIGTNRPVDDDTRVVLYFQWSFGGDWKRK